MVQSIIQSELREQAGSNSFNRFDYQAHWTLYHMIEEYKKNIPFYVFCEFHDDMTKTELSEHPSCAEFFQVKTTESFKEWTLKRLFRTYKKPNGDFKHSFLGFLFYNFLKFKDECTKCHFVSNIDMDEDVRKWQAVIEDKKLLKKKEPKLYNEIKAFLKIEYPSLKEPEFTSVFDTFIQNTFLYYGGLPLENYEKSVAGAFFIMLDNEDILTSTGNRIFKDILEDVRKKSKKKIKTPISYKSLKEEKGISSESFSRIKDQVATFSKSEQVYQDIKINFESRLGKMKMKMLIRLLEKHKRKVLDSSNVLYLESSEDILEAIDDILLDHYDKLDDLDFVTKNILNEVLEKSITLIDDGIGINKVLVEALFYERIVS
ncbi:dsDNA nuclease domain-containing protein [Bacillus sp. 22475]|uniref:dsDNA nuclease domain-containing protein n=1 Tax=Bacillus sp. 22475 TaxID=3453925 RepID=UPI002E1E710A|nr:dsDNA nuclease domain-containing protein [Bacillus thuringiensis]